MSGKLSVADQLIAIMKTKIINLLRLVLLVLITSVSTQALAAEFSIGPHGFGVLIEGEIKSGDFLRFSSYLSANINTNSKINYEIVYLNSPGGSVEEALKFADLFSKYFSTVAVIGGGNCFSACTIIWAGGVDRLLEKGARLGFHRLSFARKEVDVKKSKATVDPENQKVAAFFRSVGFPTLLLDKMNETPPTDIYVVDMRWLIEHELERVVTYQPAYFDVVEKHCGEDPSMLAVKQKRPINGNDKEQYRKWLTCTEELKTANRKISLGNLVQEDRNQDRALALAKSQIAKTKWVHKGEIGNQSFFVDLATAKWSGRVVKLWTLTNFSYSDKYTSTRNYLTIDCNSGWTASTDGTFTKCEGKMCEKPISIERNEPEPFSPNGKGSVNDEVVKAVCKRA